MQKNNMKVSTKSRLDSFKRTAKKLKRDEGISHTEALEKLARMLKFKDFYEARKVLSAD